MSHIAELRAQRRVTTAFIGASPTSVALTPVKRTKTPSGGYSYEPQTPRAPQRLRLIDQSSQSTAANMPGKIRTADGVERTVTHQLLGEYDAVLAVWDFWMGEDGTRFEIVEMLPDNGYEQRAKVVNYGG